MGIWNDFAREIRPGLLKTSRRMTIAEIVAATGTRDRAIRETATWEAAKKGMEAYRALADEGITCDYELGGDGKVAAVTFYLSWLRPSDG